VLLSFITPDVRSIHNCAHELCAQIAHNSCAYTTAYINISHSMVVSTTVPHCTINYRSSMCSGRRIKTW